MAYTRYFWNLRTARPQNWLMPGLMFAMTFCKRSPLGKRLRALFLGVSHHKQHPCLSLPASFSKNAFWSSQIAPLCLIAQPITHHDRRHDLSFIRPLPPHLPSWVKACPKGNQRILLSLVRVSTGTKNISRLGWIYFIIPSGPSFLGHGLHWALCPKTRIFLRTVQTATPGFSLFMSEWLWAWND